MTQFVSPDDEHDVLETCRELKNKDKCIEFVSPDDEHDVFETCRELKNKDKCIEKNCASRWSFTKTLTEGILVGHLSSSAGVSFDELCGL